MLNEVKLGNIVATRKTINTRYSLKHVELIINGVGGITQLMPQAWEPLKREMISFLEGGQYIGFRTTLDFSGAIASPLTRVFFTAADCSGLPSAFAADWGEPESTGYPNIPGNYITNSLLFDVHDPGNVLYHIANGLTEKYSWVSNIRRHFSSSEHFTVFTDGNPKAAVHSLIVAKEGFTCTSHLSEGRWNELGQVLAAEVARLAQAGIALEKIGYRVIMNSGPGTMTVAQQHAHLVSGNPGLWPVLPLE